MSRLLFRRYLVPFGPAVLLVPVGVALALALLLAATLPPGEGAPTEVVSAAAESGGSEESAASGGGAAAGANAAARVAATSDAPAGTAAVEIRLTFLGDIMAHTVNFTMADYARIYEDVREELLADDLTFANLETPVVPSHPYESYPRFNVHPEYAEAAVDAGVEVFSAANNHTTDRGPSGITETRAELAELASRRGVAWNGIREEPGEELGLTALRVGEKRIGFVAVTQFLNDPFWGQELVHLVDYRRKPQADAFVEWVAVRSLGFDLFVVSYHGGAEYALAPEPARSRFFERLTRAGADIVWAHHPHVVQPWRQVAREDGSHALILHSTGNFISGQTWRLGPEHASMRRAHTGDTVLFRVTARWDARERITLDHDPLLAANYRDPVHGMVVRRLDGLITDDIDPAWKRYYVLRRNSMRETTWRSESVRLAEAGSSVPSPARSPASSGAVLD
mgnify:CR=1 FL=1